MECPFEVGDEIVCANLDMPADSVPNPNFQLPVIGEVYQIRAVFESPRIWYYHPEFPIFVSLIGITCPFSILDGKEPGFPAKWFRKVEKRSSDATVAALKKMMREHVDKASGGQGIKKPVNA